MKTRNILIKSYFKLLLILIILLNILQKSNLQISHYSELYIFPNKGIKCLWLFSNDSFYDLSPLRRLEPISIEIGNETINFNFCGELIKNTEFPYGNDYQAYVINSMKKNVIILSDEKYNENIYNFINQDEKDKGFIINYSPGDQCKFQYITEDENVEGEEEVKINECDYIQLLINNIQKENSVLQLDELKTKFNGLVEDYQNNCASFKHINNINRNIIQIKKRDSQQFDIDDIDKDKYNLMITVECEIKEEEFKIVSAEYNKEYCLYEVKIKSKAGCVKSRKMLLLYYDFSYRIVTIVLFLIFGTFLSLIGVNNMKISFVIQTITAINVLYAIIFNNIDIINYLNNIDSIQIGLEIIKAVIYVIVGFICMKFPKNFLIKFTFGLQFGYLLNTILFNMILYNIDFENYYFMLVYSNYIPSGILGIIYLFVSDKIESIFDDEGVSRYVRWFNYIQMFFFSFIGSFYIMRSISLIFYMYLDNYFLSYLYYNFENDLVYTFMTIYMIKYNYLWICLTISSFYFQVGLRNIFNDKKR